MDELERMLKEWSLEDANEGVVASTDWKKERDEAAAKVEQDPDDGMAHASLARASLHLREWKAYVEAVDSASKKITAAPLKKLFEAWKKKAENEIFEADKKRFEENYRCLEAEETKLGNGSFGTVYIALNKTEGNPVAVKVLVAPPKKGFVNFLATNEREVKVWQTIKHPFILKLFDSFVWHGNVRIVMELVIDGNLEEYIEKQAEGKCSEQETRLVAKQLCLGMAHMHELDVVSRMMFR